MHMSKRTFPLVLAMVIMFQTFLVPGQSAKANISMFSTSSIAGDGTAINPYIIMTREQLYSISMKNNQNTYFDKHIQLGADIDFADWNWDHPSNQWTPIGRMYPNNSFQGVFDGRGYVISNMKIGTGGGKGVGFFGFVGETGIIKNVILSDIDVSGSLHVGALVGDNQGRIESSSAINVTVKGISNVGGLVGLNGDGGTIRNSLAGGSITGVENTGSGSAGAEAMGGLAGRSFGKIYTSFAYGKVEGTYQVGGLVGYHWGDVIDSAYSLVNVSKFGGIHDNIGGLVGYNADYRSIKNSYAAGEVIGEAAVGGLIGNNGSDEVYSSYWNSELNAVGIGKNRADGVIIHGLETDSFYKAASFGDFDFENTWTIMEEVGSPYLLHSAELNDMTAQAGNVVVGQSFTLTGILDHPSSTYESFILRAILTNDSNEKIAEGVLQQRLTHGEFTADISTLLQDYEAELAVGDYTLWVWATHGASGTHAAKIPLKVVEQIPPPAAPKHFLAAAGDQQVVLEWEEVTDADYYAVYYYEGEAAPIVADEWIEANAVISDTTYTVEGLENETTYVFAVKAIKDNQASDFSEIMLATPFKRSDNSLLDSITINDVIIAGFLKNTLNYTIDVKHDTEQIIVKATPSDSKANYTMSVPESYVLFDGDNEIIIVVTAENGLKTTYTLNVRRAEDRDDGGNKVIAAWPDGSRLTVSDVTYMSAVLAWPPTVAEAGVAEYRIWVDDMMRLTVAGDIYSRNLTELQPNTAYSFTVEALDREGNIISFLNSNAMTLAKPSGGNDRVALSNNANLLALNVWANDQRLLITPTFTSSRTEYMLQTELTEIVISANLAHPAASVKLNHNEIRENWTVQLHEGENIFELTVLAADGSIKVYTLTVDHIIQTPETVEEVEPSLEDNIGAYMQLTDIAGYWAEELINQAIKDRLINGYSDQTFRPDNEVTRAEFTLMLMNAFNKDRFIINNTSQLSSKDIKFSDQNQIGQWARNAVLQAVHAGIVTGYEDGSFRPDNAMTRAEMAVMIAKALQLTNDSDSETNFSDNEFIPHWAKWAVAALRELGIVEGRGDNRFAPKETATRAEAIVLILRLLKY